MTTFFITWLSGYVFALLADMVFFPVVFSTRLKYIFCNEIDVDDCPTVVSSQGGSDQWWRKSLRANTLCCSGWQWVGSTQKGRNIDSQTEICFAGKKERKQPRNENDRKEELKGLQAQKDGRMSMEWSEYFWEKVMGASSVGRTHYQPQIPLLW